MKDAKQTTFASEAADSADLEAAFRVAADLSNDGICIIEPAGEVIFANQMLLSWVERRPELSGNGSVCDWVPADEEANLLAQLARIVHREASEATFFCHFLARDGALMPLELRIRSVSSDPAAALAIVARQSMAGEPDAPCLQSALRKDPLTGLADRDALMDWLATVLRSEGNRQFALLFIDVDEFKQVNDRFGHLVGDQVLCEVAQRLSGCVRSGDRLARFGGDEFVILLDGIGSSGGGIRAVVARIRAAFEAKFLAPDGEVRMSVSVGVAEPGDVCGTAQDLLRAADQAMYAAKRGNT